LYAAADAERISEYILTIEQKKEIRHTQEVGTMRKDIPQAERTYLAVPYAERHEAKAVGARWDAVKKAWYVGSEADREKITKWEPKHQPAPTLAPRAEFAAVLREIGAVVQGEHPIMNGEAQRIPAVNDKRGELTIFYVAHEDGVPNGYAENNRTKHVIRWKATGQHLSPEAKADLAAEAEQKRYARKQAERELYEATAQRLGEELRISKRSRLRRRLGHRRATGMCWCQATMWTGNYGRSSISKRMERSGLRKIRVNTRMFSRGRCAEWRGGAAKNSDVSGGGDCGRLRNSSDARRAWKGVDVSRVRLRQPPFGRNIHT
jgi:hypothetical protein